MRKLILAVLIGMLGVVLSFGPAAAGTLVSNTVNYAVEDVRSTTQVWLPNVMYSMGVQRTLDQDFVVHYGLSGGATYAVNPVLSCFDAAGANQSSFIATRTLGGAGSSTVVFAIDVVGTLIPMPVNGRLSLRSVQVSNSGLTADGNSLTVSLDLYNDAETARIDNAATVSNVRGRARVCADWGIAANRGPGQDAGTTIDVNAATGPLTGFLVQNDDSVGTAVSALNAFRQDAGNAVRDNLNGFNFSLTGADTVTVNIGDQTGFLGLATDGLFYDLNNDSNVDTGEIFSIAGNTATLTFAGNLFNNNLNVQYTADGTTQLGTGRTLSLSGSIDAATGTDRNLTGNTSWWVWNSNATVLTTPLFQVPSGWICRFVLTNSGSIDRDYSATLLAETGNTITPGSAATGTIPAGGTLVLNGSDVASGFTGNTRGTAIFICEGPQGNIDGAYQLVNVTTQNVTQHLMRQE